MLKKVAALAVITALSGCSLIDGDKYSQSTQAAIQQSETNLTNQLHSYSAQIDKQNDQINYLSIELSNLNNEISKLRQEQAAQFKKLRAKKAVIEPPKHTSPVVEPSRTLILGGIEKVKIDTIKQQFDARVDTGAATSSINAVDIQEFERNGNTWIKFHISDGKTAKEDQLWIESPVIRYVKIRQSTSEETERRPVVELWVQVGNIHEKAQFTLADRSQMSHAILLGREFIQDIALVDVSKSYLQSENK
ncbi:ATP-dependent zinc protease [Vibrio sp. S9_S30]|uniref:ATP-dependent zinc protease family protein n=1 Tax=Vibrio sp. S9_S30 TaxID=2720226 RepID=UPI001681B2DF|nr:ATP-dependent zinc protease [Vibrio sp. S9_S30]MBD1557876.1 ATP-dependent zinc protease [Vibrio sp. S9_S30]